ncbi:MAG: GDSL-type esterase/lipase family protein [Bacteroidota bacterium]
MPDGRIRVYLLGDSTMADKPLIDNPECGWGEEFPLFFDDGVVIENHARNGRSTKSFINEGCWQAVVKKLQSGDYVFVQFGHNDSKATDSTRYAEAHTTYKQNLLKFVHETKEKGAIPVLLTPVNRRKFDSSNMFVDQHGEYPGVVREVARDEKIALIDLHEKSRKLFEQLGPEDTKSIFLWVKPGVYATLPDGKEDNTHFTKYGAVKIAGLVVEGLRQLDLPLAKHLTPLEPDSVPGLRKIVALDYFFNCEWRIVDSNRIQFHYVWEDTTDSGFSQLGAIISKLGADIVAVRRAPTENDLKNYSVYIIVDPDTPAETEKPNYITEESIDVIVPWVESGGVLVLMGNDKGNAEFEHFNRLAERFGIHFNEDKYHAVVNNDYSMGKSDNLPTHPIFKNVKQIFIKEVSSLRIGKPAEPVLTENGLVLMAAARFGKGLVFVIGDPWLYNEYMDTRRLPAEYENSKAGRNLFQWLLGNARSLIR